LKHKVFDLRQLKEQKCLEVLSHKTYHTPSKPTDNIIIQTDEHDKPHGHNMSHKITNLVYF